VKARQRAIRLGAITVVTVAAGCVVVSAQQVLADTDTPAVVDTGSVPDSVPGPDVVLPEDTSDTAVSSCDVDAIQGADWVPSDIVCPHTVDAGSVTTCTSGGFQALDGSGVGHADVQDALDATPAGGVVTLCPGDWSAPSWVVNGVTLRAADPSPGATRIFGIYTEFDTSSNFIEAHDATLIGITVAYDQFIKTFGDIEAECITGSEFTGEVFVVETTGALTVRHSVFEDGIGGVVNGRFDTDEILVEDCLFQNNNSIAASKSLLEPKGPITVRRSAFLNNSMRYGQVVAIEADSHSVYVEDALLEGNTNTASFGSGVIAGDGAVTLRNVTLRRNSDGIQAGFNGVAGDHLELYSVTVEDNTSTGHAPVEANTLVVDDVRIVGSVLDKDSGGSAIDANDVVALNMAVLGNSGGAAAAWVHNIACTCCDFGNGLGDNTPIDVHVAKPTGYTDVVLDEAPLNFTH